MPQQLYSRLERLAELSRRSLESVVLQTLDSNIPPLPDDLPDEMRSDLSKLENLGDETLWEIAQSTGTRIIGLTPCGRATAAALRFQQ